MENIRLQDSHFLLIKKIDILSFYIVLKFVLMLNIWQFKEKLYNINQILTCIMIFLRELKMTILYQEDGIVKIVIHGQVQNYILI